MIRRLGEGAGRAAILARMIEGSVSAEFAEAGYVVIADVLTCDELNVVARNVDGPATEALGRRKLLDARWCQELARRLAHESRLRAVIPADGRPVQCTLFEKRLGRNWLVALHQDLSIPVAERIDNVRCTGWSEKDGSLFVQPPMSVLEELVAIRVHLDDCDERNGALRVVPGSHRLGRLSSAQALQSREVRGDRNVPVAMGGVMVMRPLLLHASSKVSLDLPRRVLHFVFGPGTLPEGLRWPPSSVLVV
jgi:ectoine hydroxylase-related dioxygenase (phytanoyl-CoA dioxygenase family)